MKQAFRSNHTVDVASPLLDAVESATTTDVYLVAYDRVFEAVYQLRTPFEFFSRFDVEDPVERSVGWNDSRAITR